MESCEIKDIALKSTFLGPQSENSVWVLEQVHSILIQWFEWRKKFAPKDGKAISDSDMLTSDFIGRRKQMGDELRELMHRFEKETPRFSPRYIGHMYSEISLPALFGHIVTLLHNPNNISGECSQAGISIEDEAIAALAKMLGYKDGQTQGHFTSGGTIANFEALVRARARFAEWLACGACDSGLTLFEAAHLGWEKFETLKKNLRPDEIYPYNLLKNNPWVVGKNIEVRWKKEFKGPIVLVPQNKHYSWVKGVSLLGLGHDSFWSVKIDHRAHLCLDDLKSKIEKARQEDRPILMIVSVAGTTELGQIDRIDKIQALLDEYRTKENLHIWHHVDAAYGGFFTSLLGSADTESVLKMETLSSLSKIGHATSITIDPHKLGYVPYASGTFLCQNQKDYDVLSFSAPYLVFEKNRDKWPYTLEGSRSAAGAVATWMIHKSVGLDQNGYGRILKRTIKQRQELEQELNKVGSIHIISSADTNVLCFFFKETSLQAANQKTLQFIQSCENNKEHQFWVSKTLLTLANYADLLQQNLKEAQVEKDDDQMVVVRLCLLNPFFSSQEMTTNFFADFVQLVMDFSNT